MEKPGMFFPWWLARPVERGLWRGRQQPWGCSCPRVSRGPTDPFPKIKDVGSCLEAGEFLLRNWFVLMGMLSHGKFRSVKGAICISWSELQVPYPLSSLHCPNAK